jgi:hypothetical protein
MLSEWLVTVLLRTVYLVLALCGGTFLLAGLLSPLYRGLVRLSRRVLIALDEEQHMRRARELRRELDVYHQARKDVEAVQQKLHELLDKAEVEKIPIHRQVLKHKTEILERCAKKIIES